MTIGHVESDIAVEQRRISEAESGAETAGHVETLDEYQIIANSFINRERYGEINTEEGQFDYLNNTALGLTGESGEFADLFKKIRFHGHPYTQEERMKFIKELGDVLWYVSQGCVPLGTTLSEIANMNLRKLEDRHGGFKFSESASINKDETKEAPTLVGDTKKEQRESRLGKPIIED